MRAFIIACRSKTHCIGIDPEPQISEKINKNTEIFEMTSDDFFQKHPDIKDIDMAFIDGMHLFDYVLRDFINLEKCCKKNAIILMHDTIPKDKITSERNRTTRFWTGDVFKIVLILKKYHPDLEIYNSNAKPSGLVCVKNLDSSSTVLSDNYEKIVEEFMNTDYSDIEHNKSLQLFVKDVEGLYKFLKI